MSQREQLRALLSGRLASTGDGINALFEEKIREYEQEVDFLTQESSLRQRLLDRALKEVRIPVELCEEDPGPGDDAESSESSSDSAQTQQEPRANHQQPSNKNS